MGRPTITPEQKAIILEMLAEKVHPLTIATAAKVSLATVYNERRVWLVSKSTGRPAEGAA